MKTYENLDHERKYNNPHYVNQSVDVPGFPLFYDYAKLVGGSSLCAANLIAEREHEVVLNWIGGMHHARPNQAYGFCYVNDCVLAIK